MPLRNKNQTTEQQRPSVKLGLFGRTFALLALLMLVSLVLWVQVFLNVEQGPKAIQMAQRVSSVVSISRSALTHTPEDQRSSLLLDLATKESLRVQPLDPTDKRQSMPSTRYWDQVSREIKDRLGENTHISWSVNDIPGVWVSFRIDKDHYWLVFEREQLEASNGLEWLVWVISAVILALIGAAISVSFVNRPLAQLSAVAKQLSKGETPSPLPEKGPSEIRDMNIAFNRMARDIRKTDSDREMMLAGLSHDLRTPLARMRLEIEMSPMSDETKAAIDEDLAQINHSIEQLMEYARPAAEIPTKGVNVSQAMQEIYERERTHTQLTSGSLTAYIEPSLYSRININEIKRAVINLIENARRYGASLHDGKVRIHLVVKQHGNKILIEISDEGRGIDPHEVERLLRPFSRGDQARTGVSGAGLGLAIVARLVSHAGGNLWLDSNSPSGLLARIELPRVRAPIKTLN